ncbi:hypothetical protein Krac_8985 [Ktedonobacter racemifer DSM 44963]|uniref:Uncharacterized protein n=1 Tax=Ktedonobacter racemifer DSM 44963 TaxID=485913 RepID=D6TQH4_KTERA|nr:hypothetical protein Krac_8985 [Ktedonobacter racemifer DSM 44963]
MNLHEYPIITYRFGDNLTIWLSCWRRRVFLLHLAIRAREKLYLSEFYQENPFFAIEVITFKI